MDYENFLELVKKRRSIRQFKPDPIPDEYVDKIIEAARWAPSTSNSQPWEFIVIKKPEIKNKIHQLYMERSAINYQMELTREPERRYPTMAKWIEGPFGFAKAPVFILVCGDPRTKEIYPLSLALEFSPIEFYSSLASAFLYMHLAATTLGLGSQWASTVDFPSVQCQVKQLLGIPKELEIYEMMAVGYPDVEPKPRLVRAKEEMVHHDYYEKNKFRTDEKIKDFIAALYGRR